MKELSFISSKTQKQIGIQVMAAFAGAILAGALILMIPQMTLRRIRFIDALFTSTSAICVTGLIVQDTAKYFTDLGKSVILILIQLGGLGIMTIGSIFGLILGKKIQIKDKFYIDSSFGPRQQFTAARFFAMIAAVTAVIEIDRLPYFMVLLLSFQICLSAKDSIYLRIFSQCERL